MPPPADPARAGQTVPASAPASASKKMVALDRRGGRRIELFIPFEYEGKMVEAVEIGAPQFDHVIRWQGGEYKNALALLSAMSGMTQVCLRKLRYPDAERVFAAFMDMLPDAIRADVHAGIAPRAVEAPEEPGISLAQREAIERATPRDDDDGGGFDLGD
jgi:hypothetical protein